MKNMARGKGKNQNMEESVQAREVSRKRKVNDDKLFACDNRVLKRFVRRNVRRENFIFLKRQ